MLKKSFRTITCTLLSATAVCCVALVLAECRVGAQSQCPTQVCPTQPSGNGVTCCNGDINGDCNIDVADAAALLGYLFNGGPAPAAFAAPAACPACLLSQADVATLMSLLGSTNGLTVAANGQDVGLGFAPVDFGSATCDPLAEFDPISDTTCVANTGTYVATANLRLAPLVLPQSVTNLHVRLESLDSATPGAVWELEADEIAVTQVGVNSAYSVSVTRIVKMNAGDKLRVTTNSSAGVPFEVLSGPTQSYFQVTRIR